MSLENVALLDEVVLERTLDTATELLDDVEGGTALEVATLLEDVDGAALEASEAELDAEETSDDVVVHSSIFMASTCCLLPESTYTENPV